MKATNTAETILNALAEPVLVLDESLRAVAANPSFYDTLMIPPGLLKGREIQEFISEDRDAQHLRTLLESVATRQSDEEHLEVECDITSGVKKVLSLTARRVQFGDGANEMVLVELRDITRREAAERKILELNAALQTHSSELELINLDLESFTYTVSHDLRSPLRLANKIAHLLLQEHGSELSPGAVEKIQMILDSTREMGKLVEDLLAFAHVRTVPVKKRPVGVRRLAHEVFGDLCDEHEGREVSFRVDSLPPCVADRALLKQLFLNLLTNALKYTLIPEKAIIHVGFQNADGETIYFVRDNGMGFEERYAGTVFLPFHRLHRDQGIEGSGLGLALAKRIVECHGGRIWLKSQVGIGTTMYFTLKEQPAGTAPAEDRKHPL